MSNAQLKLGFNIMCCGELDPSLSCDSLSCMNDTCLISGAYCLLTNVR